MSRYHGTSHPSRGKAMRHAALALACLALAACATTDTNKEAEKLTDAATSPLADLNLIRAKIPDVLKDAIKAPYAKPVIADCESIVARVKALDEALGPDVDAPPAAEQGLLERGGKLAEEQAWGALRGAAEGLIPYRSWVRRLSGAERQTRMVAAAVAAGGVQRAYLKGIGESKGCPYPGSPRLATAAD